MLTLACILQPFCTKQCPSPASEVPWPRCAAAHTLALMATKPNRRSRLRDLLRRLGPGLITGAADDDPSGIATYSQAGARFGYSLLWTVVFTLPLMAAIQIISARIGYVTRHGLAANIKAAYPRWVLLAIVGMLVVANTLNIAADLAAMAEALRLLFGGSAHVYAITFGLLTVLLQVFLPYRSYVRWLKWLTLALLAYVVLVFTLDLDLAEVLRGALALELPPGANAHDAILMIVARVRDDDQSLSVFLAGRSGKGGSGQRQVAHGGARPAAPARHQDRHDHRHDVFQPGRVFHHSRAPRRRCIAPASRISRRRLRPPRRCARWLGT